MKRLYTYGPTNETYKKFFSKSKNNKINSFEFWVFENYIIVFDLDCCLEKKYFFGKSYELINVLVDENLIIKSGTQVMELFKSGKVWF